MINPEVTNASKTQHYVAIVLDESKKLGVQCQRTVIERAVRDMKCGNSTDNRYFLKQGVLASTMQGQPKSNTRKVRCCTINKAIVNEDILRKLYQGIYMYITAFQY